MFLREFGDILMAFGVEKETMKHSIMIIWKEILMKETYQPKQNELQYMCVCV